jgi:hypothetical protein
MEISMRDLDARLLEMLPAEDRTGEENGRLVRLMRIFLELEPPPDPFGLFPEYAEYKRSFQEIVEAGNSDTTVGDALEEAFLTLYCHLHGHEAPYTSAERRLVDQTGGYWCHAGGISPLLKAEPFIRPQTVSADFGAGNGLQGLLLQKLYPHKKTIQIEISARMVEAGKHLQQWLGIPPERVEWIAGDVCDVAPRDMDFIYLYRPLRPEGKGKRFYEQFAQTLETQNRSIVIFSIADCLRQFLLPRFKVFYSDGHLTCFRGGGT